jgi:hypothetical protein
VQRANVVAPPSQVEPHLARTEPVRSRFVDQFENFGVTQRLFRWPPGGVVVVRRRGDLDAVLSQHGADRLDPELILVEPDEVD